jgi:hypothetical protein
MPWKYFGSGFQAIPASTISAASKESRYNNLPRFARSPSTIKRAGASGPTSITPRIHPQCYVLPVVGRTVYVFFNGCNGCSMSNWQRPLPKFP